MNVKPKDLAMVVNANHPNRDGATCTVLEATVVDRRDVTIGGPYWNVLFARPMPVGDGTIYKRDMAFPDVLLRKIAGPDVGTYQPGTEDIQRQWNCRCVVKEVQS